MKTKIFSLEQIKKAAELIRKGGLVAFPTETVYGIGANAFDPEPVKKIFIAKGRPSDNPLIVHIAKKKQLNEIAKIKLSEKILVEKLIQKFWPGPLTIVLKKTEKIPLEVTGGLNTVAVRMPKKKIALRLINYSKVPIAAPSANLSGKPSGTCFEHVFEDFNGKIAGIIKSKSCEIGLESTVVDLTTDRPILLRPGAISFEELKKFLPNLRKHSCKKINKVKSPGMKYKHYSPDAMVFIVKNDNEIKTICEEHPSKKIKILKYSDEIGMAKNLYKDFLKSDKEGYNIIIVREVKDRGFGCAIMDRLRKASVNKRS